MNNTHHTYSNEDYIKYFSELVVCSCNKINAGNIIITVRSNHVETLGLSNLQTAISDCVFDEIPIFGEISIHQNWSSTLTSFAISFTPDIINRRIANEQLVEVITQSLLSHEVNLSSLVQELEETFTKTTQ